MRPVRRNNYLMFSKAIKTLVILIFFGTIMALVIYPNLSFFKEESAKQEAIMEKNEITKSSLISPGGKTENEISNPNFYGVDKNGNPYSIKATIGLKESGDLLHLKQVNADFKSGSAEIDLISDTAHIKTESSLAKLEGNITFSYNKSIHINSDFANIDYKNYSADGKGNVLLQSDMGTINAEQFTITDDYKTIVFEGGRVKTNLNMKHKAENEQKLKK